MSTSVGPESAPPPRDERSGPAAYSADPYPDRQTVVEREKHEYGGIKVGSAFFGWLTATGTAVLLTAILAAVGTAVGLGADVSADPQTAGIVGAVLALLVLFVAYFCGGYVAGRMARFNGGKQGLAVWLWGLVIAIVVAVLGLVAGDQFTALGQVSSLPRLPISESDLTTGAIVAALAVAAVSLLGAVLGGKTGMRFHRKVDEAGLGR